MTTLLVDDHALIREALRVLLSELRPDIPIVEASDCGQTMRMIAETPRIDLILLDLGLPDGDGIAVLAELRRQHPGVAVVVLSAHQDRSTVAKTLELGAVGFIPKSSPRAVMFGALQLVLAGGVYVPPEILKGEEPAKAKRVGRVSPAELGFTERQLEVLALMMQGKSNKEICRVLALAEPTVKNHVTAILKALKANNRTEAVVIAGELKWALPIVPGS